MKIKENIVYLFILGFVIFILYIFAAVYPIHKEIQYVPEWTVNFNDEKIDSVKNDSNLPLIPFRLGQYMGYIAADGSLTGLKKFPVKASISEHAWTEFSDSSAEFSVISPYGTVLSRITAAGYPFIDDDRLFVFGPNGNSISSFSFSGERLWAYEYYAPVICFSSSSSASAAGYADGSISYFTPKGDKQFSFFPGGSTRQIIYGTSVSPSGSLIASVSGLDQQRFTLVKVTDTQQKIIFHQYLTGELRESVYVAFNKTEDTVYYHCSEGIGIVDCENLTSVTVPLNGKVIDVEEIPAKKMVFVLCFDAGIYKVYVLQDKGKLIGLFSFAAADACIAADQSSLYVGRDASISKIVLVKE